MVAPLLHKASFGGERLKKEKRIADGGRKVLFI